ncbi:MAG: 16S rRNA (cytosine(1402)-N(4))-methyltransferase RsmH [Acidobacteria bacterium]|nr:16S rRNA (cytosine(1402)-N(4))-methyltransferase RsmH [Acidobacteriota bacterium]MCG2814878.1 16S rRNA (cytosine(1402)-N(4))-methyltransferase RsmH [Candidatus Aminicenantes bacterium]MBU1338111.1 16S rRNA (cytosine(1402)-N(4))-methyltransferase RsmH [Acidobacteriota bacterium]MBU1473473.1 16S rRNA (cytosine(1402)-N(4))-methyltransferase RsmH [Acidobacteriota bacterium]MBU4254706.1 16S rRNA (cytosine(1402)-N(4))-methyltransferase RsmH [Acidobacteriota bacterium]
MEGAQHVPVLREEVLEHLGEEGEGLFVDCTIGLGGHSRDILTKYSKARLIGLDLDERSLLQARENLAEFGDRVSLFHSDFRFLPDLNLDFRSIRGILIDLGISSFQLDSPGRGFSYQKEGPLDMRMDRRNKYTADRIINKGSEQLMARIFFEYGELRQARRLAREIVSRRKIRKIETTTELRRLVEEICRWHPQKGRIHPAAKVFQALRIEVNQELKDLDEFIQKITSHLSPGARIVAISFHSLEDRIVKHAFVNLASSLDGPPSLRILTKKPVIPTEKEVDANFRARSAKLRAAEKLP